MPISDERIMELAKLNCSIHGHVFPTQFARAIEAEATKPQEPIKLNIVRKWPEGFQDRLQCVWLDVVSFTPNVKLYDLQRVLAEFGFAMEIYEGNATPQPCQSCAEKQSAIDVWEGRYADLSAKCAELEDFCISQGNELAKLDEKVFDQDRLLKQQAEKISATLVALAGLPDGALDGGWTYAGMNKYALGLEAKCAELEAEVEKWSTDFVRISDNYSEEAQMNMDFSAERLAFILKEQKQAARIKELEAALTDAIDEIDSLACMDNTCDPRPNLSEYYAALKGEQK